MLRVLLLRVLVVGLMLLAQTAVAQDALDAVSSEAAVVIRVKAPKTTVEQVADFAAEVDENYGGLVKNQATNVGVAIHNQTLDGVNQEADWWIAVYPGEDPVTVFIIPATDLKAMKAAVGDQFTFHEHGKFGVYSRDEDAITAVKEKKGTSIAKSIDAPSKAVFDKGDLSVYVNIEGLLTKYKDEVEDFQEKIQQQLEDQADSIPVNPASGLKSEDVAKIARQMIKTVFNGISDSHSFTLTLDVSDDGLVIDELLRVKNGSGFDKLLQKSPPSTLDLLGALPAESQGYVGVSFDVAGLVDFGSQFVGMLKTDEKTQALMKEAMAVSKQLKYGPSVSSFSIDADSDDGAISAVQISQVSPSEKVRDLNRKLTTMAKESEANGFKQVMKLEADKETAGGSKVDVITMTFEPGDDADPAISQMIETALETAFGEDGLVQRYAYLPDTVVQTVGGGKSLMESTVAALKKKPTAGEAVAGVRKQLGGKSNFLLLLDLPNLVLGIGQTIAESEQIPENILPADAFKGLEIEDSYFGFSISTEPQGLKFSTVIPVEQIQGVMKVVKKVQSLHQ